MTPTQYQELAQRTSATVENQTEILERLKAPNVISALAQVAAMVVEGGYRLDLLKKLLFYGKTFPVEALLTHGPVDPVVATRIINHLSDPALLKLLHGAIGKATEAGELLDSLMGTIIGQRPLDRYNLNEEVGDGLWYDAEIISALGSSFEGIMQNNIDKLKARYGNKFNEEGALNRDLVNERKILESDDKSKISQIIFEALGEASMCWLPTPTGVFDSSACEKIGLRVVGQLTQ